MEPDKILYVDTESFWRGGQEQLLGLMKGMKEFGYEVYLASPDFAPLFLRARKSGIQCFDYKQKSEFSLFALARLLQIFRRHMFDVVHFNTPRPLFAGGVAVRAARVPLSVCSRRVNFPLKNRVSAFKYNWCVDEVFTVSTSIRKTLIQGGVLPAGVRVIYEGVDVGWIDSLKPAEVESLGAGRLVVGTVAHLSSEKGHVPLIRAAAKLLDEFPEVHFVIVGEGQLRETLEAQVSELGLKDWVSFTGFREDSESLMKNFDIFCLPSLSEGLSSAILAAMAIGLPVVSTRVGGIPELVNHEETGLLVRPGDADDLAGALGRLLTSDELRRKMGAAGRRRVQRVFTVERKLELTRAAYRELLAEERVR